MTGYILTVTAQDRLGIVRDVASALTGLGGNIHPRQPGPGSTAALAMLNDAVKKGGERAVFGGLFGESPILNIRSDTSNGFVSTGGRMPAPLTSLNN